MGSLFAGAAGAALLKVLAPIIEALLNGIGRSFNDWLAQKRAEQAQRELGAAQTTSTINKESADAERRASEVAVNRPDVGAVVAGMERGDAF
ncbi:hypothetical protein [Rhodopseudomonas sp. B29]|uniref:hypothetical protein n=1 Tax=Rhodopseudomonas sp. B29 TaxID=95607 RepID=UPI00034C3BC7|nr:hypothetical protein [Rhodopseudomonas sp. B29]